MQRKKDGPRGEITVPRAGTAWNARKFLPGDLLYAGLCPCIYQMDDSATAGGEQQVSIGGAR